MAELLKESVSLLCLAWIHTAAVLQVHVIDGPHLPYLTSTCTGLPMSSNPTQSNPNPIHLSNHGASSVSDMLLMGLAYRTWREMQMILRTGPEATFRQIHLNRTNGILGWVWIWIKQTNLKSKLNFCFPYFYWQLMINLVSHFQTHWWMSISQIAIYMSL